MKKRFPKVILLLMIATVACGQSPINSPTVVKSQTISTPAATPAILPSVTSAPEITIIPPHTVVQTMIATNKPEPTSTNTPIPIPEGLLSVQELQQRIDDWVSGKTEFSDDQRLLDEKSGKELKLGLLDYQMDMVIFNFYNLGFSVLPDLRGIQYLINVAGFEDSQGQRFTIVFHNGRLLDQNAKVTVRTFEGRRINHTINVSHENLFPTDLAQLAPDLSYKVFTGWTFTDGITGDRAKDRYLSTVMAVSVALVNYLSCNECSYLNANPLLTPIINHIPETYEDNMPYITAYNTHIW